MTNEDIFRIRAEYEKETGFKVDYLSDSIITYTNWLEKRIVKLFAIPDIVDCSTCKHQKVSKYVAPCYGCRDNDGYDNFSSAITP